MASNWWTNFKQRFSRQKEYVEQDMNTETDDNANAVNDGLVDESEDNEEVNEPQANLPIGSPDPQVAFWIGCENLLLNQYIDGYGIQRIQEWMKLRPDLLHLFLQVVSFQDFTQPEGPTQTAIRQIWIENAMRINEEIGKTGKDVKPITTDSIVEVNHILSNASKELDKLLV